MASFIATTALAARQRNSDDYDDLSSPSQISPELTQSASNSASNTSSSPPELETPPRANRYRDRYPDLGRVPLHRRGTSKQYERLEDLLKEAGYKETRIFTPETERVEKNAQRDMATNDDNRLSVVKDSVGSVVGFLAGFMPGVSGYRSSTNRSASVDNLTASPQEYSPPLSPLTYRNSPHSSSILGTETSVTDLSHSAMTSSFGSIGEPLSASNPDIVVHASTPQRGLARHRASTSQVHLPSNRILKQSSRGSLVPISSNNVVSPRPSRATAYLRHMASIPNIPQRPSSTPINGPNRSQLSLNDNDYEIRRSGQHTPSDGAPPLPSSWLEIVARAVLFGGSNSHIGGPSTSSNTEYGMFTPTTSSTATTTRPVLRTTRSSLSQTSHYTKRPPPMTRNGLSDQTNRRTAHSRNRQPPPPPPSALFRGRSGRLDNEVSLTRVVCRSAPGSRTGSLVRGPSIDGPHTRRKERERGRNHKKKDVGGKDMFRVPSLARTQVEGDIWSSTESPKGRRGTRSHFVSVNGNELEGSRRQGQGRKIIESNHISGSDGDNDDEEDEEDDNEITLAQMLLPPKRQNSIRSLRKHLASHSQGGGEAHASLKHAIGGGGGVAGRSRNKPTASVVGAPPRKVGSAGTGIAEDEDDDDDEPGSEHLARWRVRRAGAQKRSRGSDDEDVDAFAGFFSVGGEPLGSGKSRASKNRLGINSVWSLIGGGS
ncbi:hypothetical protein CPB83DRAFT_851427 [Crepidotus variabilis]|uniref:Uncharacterized protein n=1 Tax=Crepidotus variabilis TaxID=179855 RepID=A0A9P6EJG3_9AGAR|nr:hypothetical protein CPB83DRAFT_851427 [Crepidotus variabilis]